MILTLNLEATGKNAMEKNLYKFFFSAVYSFLYDNQNWNVPNKHTTDLFSK